MRYDLSIYLKKFLILENCSYQIIEDGVPDFFKLIFYDYSFSIIDACFSPDSKSLMVIPARYPTFVFILALPLFYKSPSQSSSFLYSNVSMEELKNILQKQQQQSQGLPERTQEEIEGLLHYEARKAGPLSIVGPAKGVFGQTLKMTHIASNPNPTKENKADHHYHFVTWNDEPLGEYCLWSVAEDEITTSQTPKFRYFSKTVVFRQTEDDYDWSPKCWILEMEFSNKEAKLAASIKREYKSRKSENGIGMQMINLSEPEGPTKDVYFYPVTDSLDTSKVLCFKWTNTLFIGTSHSAAIMIEGKGIFEMVDYRFASSFQDLYEAFVNEGANFVQVERYNRFWLNKNGVLRVMVVTPQTSSFQLEWNEIEKASKTDILNMRVLGKRIGYYINTLEKDTIDYFKKRSKEKPNETAVTNGTGDIELFCGLHLHRCWFCRRLLLKPLQCSRCKSVVYCSKACQKNHWLQSHRLDCKLK